jgi:DinB superfamily
MIASRETIVEHLAAIPARLTEAARGAPPEPTAPGEWTPTDVVRHLIAVEKLVWQPRLARLAAEDHPHWAWVEPDRWMAEPGASLERLLATYRLARASTVDMLAALDDAGWARTGTHATFGVLDAAGLMARAVDHDEEHLRSFEVT